MKLFLCTIIILLLALIICLNEEHNEKLEEQTKDKPFSWRPVFEFLIAVMVSLSFIMLLLNLLFSIL